MESEKMLELEDNKSKIMLLKENLKKIGDSL